MSFEYSKLRGRIKEKYGTEGKFAKAMGLTSVTMSNKLNSNTLWTQPEIVMACKLLDVPTSEINSYFFSPKV